MGRSTTPSEHEVWGGVRAWLPLACAVAAVAGWSVARAADPTGFRKLAPGVLTVVSPPPAPPDSDASAADTSLHGDVPEITARQADLDWTPRQSARSATLLALGRDREFLRDVWSLEFAFKPPRIIDIDVPAAGMTMRRKRVWYLVYRVRNTGGRRTVVSEDQPLERKTERFEKPVRFVPQFVLETLEPLAEGEGSLAYRAYLDRVVPAAAEPIRSREDPRRRFFDSASMAATEMAPGEERWGIAVWEDVDPRIDFFSIYVRGLTNAIRWRPRADLERGSAARPGASLEEALQTLRLDFWSPGDQRDEDGGGIRVGFAGMFERMTLGSRLLDAVGRPGRDRALPVAGLDRLGLTWDKILEPDAGDGGRSLLPLEKVVVALAKVRQPADRGPIVRMLFGDRGVEVFEELALAVSGPVDADRDRTRRSALEAIGLSPETAAEKPLPSLAKIVRALEEQPTPARRREAAERFFGAAGPRIDWLAREVAAARTLATLEAIDVQPREIAAGDALAAFAVLQPAVDVEADKAKKKTVLDGLFGPRGPALYADAAAFHEGIDHAWVFRYETGEEGL